MPLSLQAPGTLRRRLACAVVYSWLAVSWAVAQTAPFEGAARGFPEMRDSSGKHLANGEFTQRLVGDRLHVRVIYRFRGGRRIDETAVFRQRPSLLQEEWSFRETINNKVQRQYRVDFRSGQATGTKSDGEEQKRWSEKISIEPGRAYAGFGFTMALKALRKRLQKGEEIELQAVAFTPKPRVVTVQISHQGLDQMRMGGRTVRGDRFLIHAKLPSIVKLFKDVPDTFIWLTASEPVSFLRWEGPLAEPDDPIIRVDLLQGDVSEPATPVTPPKEKPEP